MHEHYFYTNLKPVIGECYKDSVAENYICLLDNYDVISYALMTGKTRKYDESEFTDSEIVKLALEIPSVIREFKPTVSQWVLAGMYGEAERWYREAVGVTSDTEAATAVMSLRDHYEAEEFKDRKFTYVTERGIPLFW